MVTAAIGWPVSARTSWVTTQISALVCGWTLQTFSQGEGGAAAAGGAGAGWGAGVSWADASVGAMYNANAAPRDRKANWTDKFRDDIERFLA
jgi:hypothetical protein